MSIINYPPPEIINPPRFEKKNYEHIILWMLNNNETCEWSNFLKEPLEIPTSTLHRHLDTLKRKEYVNNFSRGHYKITSEGKKRYHELSSAKEKKRRLSYPPKLIKNRRNYDHIILWMLYNNNYCKWSDFLEEPLLINQSSLSKNLNLLINSGSVSKESKEYRITQSGKLEYSRMLTLYDLDRQSILEEESKRIEEVTKKTLGFFKNYKINDDDIQYRFLNNVLKLDYSRVKSMLRDEEDFDKILLFLSINHPNYYPNYISLEDFSINFKIKKTTLEYYIEQIVENDIYPIKFFKLRVLPDKFYYFQSDEKLEKVLKAIIEDYVTKFTYLHKLFGGSEARYSSLNIHSIIDKILDEICETLFNKDLKKTLEEFLPEYINYLAYKIETERPLRDIYDKLEGIIWQEIQAINLISQQLQCVVQDGVIYYLDPEILGILENIYAKNIKPTYNKAKTLLVEKEYDKVLNLVDSALNLKQRNIGLINFKANILFYLNRFQEAIDYLNNEIQIPDDIERDEIYIPYFFLLVFCYLTFGEFDKSLKMVDKMGKYYPEHPFYYLVKGILYGYNIIYQFDVENGKESNFIINIEKAISLDTSPSNKAKYYQLKSNILFQTNKEEESVNAIDRAISLSSDDIGLYHSKIKILIQFSRYNEVLILINNMLSNFPEYEKDLSIKKASVLKKMQSVEEGLEIIEKLLFKYPEDDFLLLNKAYWLQYLKRKEESVETIKELIERSPQIGTFHDTYGEILMYFEEYRKAADQFEKTIELEPNNWYIYQTYIKLGICYKELGYYKLAIENLEKGKALTNSCFVQFDLKQKWLVIAELFLAELAELEEEI
ncbi:MAG: hypothetical protein ACFE8M_08420 [Candidatus Hermodarchaeota archaeon]